MSEKVKLAVNGTLMRGLKLEKNMHNANATFLKEDKTAAIYRLWSIGDDHPGMIKFPNDDKTESIDLEIWEVPVQGLASILLNEPAGLSIGKVLLQNDEYVLGVLAEPSLVEGQVEITPFKGWRNYIQSKG